MNAGQILSLTLRRTTSIALTLLMVFHGVPQQAFELIKLPSAIERMLVEREAIAAVSDPYDISNAVFDSVVLSVGAQDPDPNGFLFNDDGTILYMIGTSNDRVYAYPLDVPYNIESYSSGVSSVLNVSAQEANPAALLFNDDGTSLYVLGSDGDDINEYPLPTPYDISSYTSGTSVALSLMNESTPEAMLFNDDGSILYVTGSGSDNIRQYPLPTPYDISSYVVLTSSVVLNVSGQESTPQSMKFNGDGTVLYLLGSGGDDINAYPLPTPYDISSYTSGTSIALDISPQDTNPQDIMFNSNGSVLYLMGRGGDDINAYRIPVLSPGGVAGNLGLWLKADVGVTGGASVSQWDDQSGNANHATETTGTRQPNATASTINFNPTVTFDGSSDRMSLPDSTLATGNDNYSMVIVANTDGTNTPSTLLFQGNDLSTNRRTSVRTKNIGRLSDSWTNTLAETANNVFTEGSPFLATFNYDNTVGREIFSFGESVLTDGATTHNATATNAFVGAKDGTSHYWVGDISEIVVYDADVLSSLEQQKIESYLALKYGITLSNDNDGDSTTFESPNGDGVNEGDYVLSDGTTVVWDADGLSTYHNDIAGLVRDDGAGLHQKVSKSVNSDATVAMSLENDFSSLNTDGGRTETLLDLNGLVWGNDDGPRDFVTAGAPSGVDYIMDRTWRVMESGAVENGSGNVYVEFDLSGLTLPGGGNLTQAGTYMVIDQANADFSTGANTFQALSVSGTTAVFEISEGDLADGDYFTIGCTSVSHQAPGGVAGDLALWLKADAGVTGGASVSQWDDQSGNANHATQGTGADQPDATFQEINFNPSLGFDGATDFMRLTSSLGSGNQSYSFFAASISIGGGGVFSQGDINSTNRALRFRHTNTGYSDNWFGNGIVASGLTSGIPGMASSIYNNAVGRSIRANGNSEVIDSQTVLDLDDGLPTVGVFSSLNNFFGGFISEIIFYDTNIAELDRKKIESYMALKYGITLDQSTVSSDDGTGDYLASDGTTKIFDAHDGVSVSAFHNDIFGIGRDDNSALGQVQSKSVNADAIVTVLAESEGTNSANSFVDIADLEFLTIGNNNGGDGSTEAWTSTGAPTNYHILNRQWSVQETGDVGTVQIDIDVEDGDFNVPALTVGGSYYFIYDQDNDGDLSDETPQVMTNTSGDNWRVTGVDFDSGEEFTVAQFVLSEAPGGVAANLTIWLKGDSGTNTTVEGATLTNWTDQSGSGNDASNSSGDPSYTADAINFNPGASFNSSESDSMGTAGGFYHDEYFVVFDTSVVITVSNGATVLGYTPVSGVSDALRLGATSGFCTNEIIDMRQGGGGYRSCYEDASVSIDDPALISANIRSTNNGIELQWDGFELPVRHANEGSFSDNVPQPLYLASRSGAGGNFNGTITEVIDFSETITDLEKQRVWSYLALKYGITLSTDNDGNSNALESPNSNSVNEGDYVLSDGTTVVWDASIRDGYHNDIAGIGQDSSSGLNQKISKSSDSEAIVTFALQNDFVSSNIDASRTDSATDLEFLLWGNNDDALNFVATSGTLSSTVDLVLDRTWQVQETGDVDNASGNVYVEFDVSSLGVAGTPTTADFYFVIGNTDDDFSAVTPTITATSYANDKVVFEVPEASLEDGQYFTLGCVTNTSTGSHVSPGGVNGDLALWLKADAGVTGGASVSQWNDQSGNANHATQGTSVNQPDATADTVNFNPTVTFDSSVSGEDDLLVLDISKLPTGDSDRTLFGVISSNNTSEIAYAFDYGTALTSQAFGFAHTNTGDLLLHAWADSLAGSVMTPGVSVLASGIYDGVNDLATFFEEGSIVAGPTSKSWNTGTTAAYVGANPVGSQTWDGDVSEIILYETASLTSSEQQKVESYLALKYGITLSDDNDGDSTTFESPNGDGVNEGDYVASDGTVFWDANVNSLYHNDIAGLVQDDDSALHQKIAKSVNTDAIVSVSLENDFVSSNTDAGRTSTVGNGSALVWGNNDDALSFVATSGTLSSTVDLVLDRTWKVDETGDVDNASGNVYVEFDVSSLGVAGTPTTADFYFVIGNTDDDFSSVTPTITATSYVNDKVVFEVPEASLEDGQYFTLGCVTNTSTGSHVSPGGVNGDLALWLKADEGVTESSGDVSQWDDQSGNGQNLSAVGQTPDIVADAMNFNPGIQFNPEGANTGWLRRSGFVSPTSAMTHYTVLSDGGSGGGTIFSYAEPGGPNDGNGAILYQPSNVRLIYKSISGGIVFGNDVSGEGSHIIGIDYDSATDQGNAFEDGKPNGANPYSYSSDPLISGGTYHLGVEPDSGETGGLGNYFEGKISESIWYDSVLSTLERNKIESYLALKYGITLDQTTPQDYLASDGTTEMWDKDATGASTYNHDIFGIGRDDSSGLGQVKSKSVNSDALVTIEAVGEGTNAAPSFSDIADLEFLTIGNNDQGVTSWTSSNAPSGYIRLDREWQVQETGDGVGTLTIDVDVDDVDLNIASFTGDLYFLYDLDNDGSLADETPVVMTDQGSGVWQVTGIDLDDGEEFTFTQQGKNISGTVYTDEGVTNIGAGKTVRLLVNGVDSGVTAETDVSGQFSIDVTTCSAGDILTVYLDDETENAALVTRYNSGAVTGLDLYEDYLVLRHEDAGPLTNANLDTANNSDPGTSSDDLSSLFDVSGGVLTTTTGTELLINAGDTFTPGGNLDLNGNLDINGTLDATGLTNINLAGDWDLDGAATFTPASSTVLLDGTSQQNIFGSNTFNNLTATTSAAKTLGFQESQTQTINGAATLTGAAGQLLSLRSVNATGALSTTQTTIDFRGTLTTDYLDVRDHNADSGNGAITFPIDPSNSVNSFNNTDWFGLSVTLNQAPSQADPTAFDSAVFRVVFASPINVSTFIAGDITLSGTTGTVTSGPTQIAPNDDTTFEFTVTGMTSGNTVTASMAANVVEDKLGALFPASSSTDNQVTYNVATDTDNDGISDLTECPTGVFATCTDTDGDNVPDYLEPNNQDTDNDGNLDVNDANDDGDGTNTSGELGAGGALDPQDTDGDGIPDYLDADDAGPGSGDSDNDGINDDEECPEGTPCPDSDGDGTPDYMDTDSDNDGELDSVECTTGVVSTCEDADSDGIPDYLEPDNLDTDNDGTFNDQDVDDDGDGDNTSAECTDNPFGCEDTDGDGIPDYLDADDAGPGSGDSDNDGINDDEECPEGTPCPDSDGDGTPDYMDTDSDNDGELDSVECTTGVVSTCEDADSDGIPDYLEDDTADTDNDGTFNDQDVDDDGDGDNTSAECTDNPFGCEDTDGDGIPDYLDADDAGPGSGDSDNDGINDDEECLDGVPCPDSDGDGTPDYMDTDSDDDGELDSVECTTGVVSTCEDADSDGIPDYLEDDTADTDNDGTFNDQDVDDDGDGDNTSAECTDNPFGCEDTDGDGIPDYLDADDAGPGAGDSDGDGINDDEECPDGIPCPDSDGDGTPDYMDTDSDDDGELDSAECTTGVVSTCEDADLDGIPDYLEDDTADTDNDGTTDDQDVDDDGDGDNTSAECTDNPFGCEDTDGDGIPDYLDADDAGPGSGDSDGDGINDDEECPEGVPCPDSDGDGTPDYMDTDSDNDGELDSVECTTGVVSTCEDADSDGIPDYLEDDTADTDNDGTNDDQDVDDDGDGDNTSAECIDNPFGCEDTDGDGIPDYLDADDAGPGSGDSDNDGINDDEECPEGVPCPDSDGDGTPDYMDTDSDDDGELDSVECTTGVVSTCEDADSDGIPDYLEDDTADTDNDGTTDDQDADDDGDGDNTSVECTDNPFGCEDTDGDGIPDYLDADDAGPGSGDSDNDGINDDEECPEGVPCPDSDGDGTPDYMDTDSDDDGELDSVECTTGVVSTCEDADSDGIPDYLEDDTADTDNDGTTDDQDADDDGDGDNTSAECTDNPFGCEDTDGDGIPDYLDADDAGPGSGDSDGDGINDDEECPDGVPCPDSDGDGTPNYMDTDSDNDGELDSVECTTGVVSTCEDADSDGIPDYLEPDNLDTDNDGTFNDQDADDDGDGDNTSAECTDNPFGCEDTDGDGIPDYLDADDAGIGGDSDSDGIPDLEECPNGLPCPDSDGDGTPDYQDTDSDNDGELDSAECTTSVVSTCEDADSDGIPDYLENDNRDTDGDGTTDDQDADDDGDGNNTSAECTDNPFGCEDTDGDGIPDYLDADDAGPGVGDSDNDGLNDDQECPDGIPCPDSDGDGTPDYMDTDSDEDGELDSVECTTGVVSTCEDADSDGIPDYLEDDTADTDNDGTNDDQDADDDGDGDNTSAECTDNPFGCEDTDGDGIPDYLDADDAGPGSGDSDNDGLNDDEECPDGIPCPDSDGDGTPDYMDTDSDEDGQLDSVECTTGVVSTCEDADSDGIPDYLENDNRDTDNDGTKDDQDPDDDGDGTSTSAECTDNPFGCEDTDGDGIPDYLDDDGTAGGNPGDSDGDGLLDDEECTTAPGCEDTDEDGIPDYQDEDDDGDGVNTTVERAGTNNGDGNGDGTPDYRQRDVTGAPNSVTGGYSTLAVTGCSVINRWSPEAESVQTAQDDNFDYPLGLFDFQLTCGSAGDTATVTVYLDQEYSSDEVSSWVFRKFDENTDQYFDINDFVSVTTGTHPVGGNSVTTFSYPITDGDVNLDQDLTADTRIIDPVGPAIPTGTSIEVNKTVNKTQASVGTVLTYSVEIENVSGGTLNSVTIEDRYPAGFKYVTNRAIYDGVKIANPTDDGIMLTFDIGTLASGQTSVLKYQMIVGSGVGFGEYTNSAFALVGGAGASNISVEKVTIIPDAIFDLGTMLGKVFNDQNKNGRQDDGEGGIGKAVIVMEDGTQVTADDNGLYHIPGITPGRHVFRLDERSLPEGAVLTTPKGVIRDVTEGLTVKVNFGVYLESGSDAPFTVEYEDSIEPRLNVSLFGVPLVYSETHGEFLEDARFRIFTNYHLFLDQWVLQIIDIDTERVVKAFSGDQSTIFNEIVWDGTDDQGMSLDLRHRYGYRLVVLNQKGRKDQTDVQPLVLQVDRQGRSLLADQTEDEKREELKAYVQWMESESSVNRLKVQTIPVRGEMIRVVGREGVALENVRIQSGARDVTALTMTVKEGESIESLLENPFLSSEIEQGQAQARYTQTEVILPRGDYKIVAGDIHPNPNAVESTGVYGVGWSGGSQGYVKSVEIGKDEFFFVAMGDGTVGYNQIDGKIEAASPDDRFEEDVWMDGKLAYYLRGKVRGKYLIESSLDTDRERKELFRNIDADQYYPVYGDESTVDYENADTQGIFYAKVSWDKSEVKWGNFQTQLDDTDLTAFNRTLYGGKAHLESAETTEKGDAKYKVVGFSAVAQQKNARNEFLGTGGSLYYLEQKDVIEGSEQIKIEVRDRTTGLVLSEQSLREGYDYRLDYSAGRILLSKPLSMVASSNTIISTHLLDGHEMYMVVDYEYDAGDDYREMTHGGRGQKAFGDHVVVGGTYVTETQADQDYELSGTDVKVYLGDSTELVGEYARSESVTGESSVSLDGGLSFVGLPTSQTAEGEAYSFKMKGLYLNNRLAVKSYYQWLDRNFQTSSTGAQQGKEVIGGEVIYDMTKQTRLMLKHDLQTLLDGGNAQSAFQVGGSKTETSTVQLSHVMDRAKLTAEYRHQNVEVKRSGISESNQEDDVLAARIDYKLTQKTDVYLEQQVTLETSEAEDNNQTTVGLVTVLNKWITLRAEQKVGDQGSASSVGATTNIMDKLQISGDYSILTDKYGQRVSTFGANTGLNSTLAGIDLDSSVSTSQSGTTDATTISGSYEIDEDTDVHGSFGFNGLTSGDKSNTFTLGGRKQINENMEMIIDRSMAYSDDQRIHGHTYGVEHYQDGRRLQGTYTDQYTKNVNEDVVSQVYELAGSVNDQWGLGFAYERGRVNKHDGSQDKRQAGSFKVAYLQTDEDGKVKMKSTNRFEYRLDEGNEDVEQYLITGLIEKRIKDGLHLFAEVEWSETENRTTNSTEAEYQEYTLGMAYRPLKSDRLNMIGKYSYIEDDAPVSQKSASDIEHEVFQLLSLEAILDLTHKWQLTEKVAYKWGDEKVTGFDFTETETWLWLNRLTYHVNDNWSLAGEYRMLVQEQADDVKQGALFEVARNFADVVRVALGYNLTDFNDDLGDLDYRSYGPYFRVTGGFYDRTDEERQSIEDAKMNRRIDDLARKIVKRDMRRQGIGDEALQVQLENKLRSNLKDQVRLEVVIDELSQEVKLYQRQNQGQDASELIHHLQVKLAELHRMIEQQSTVESYERERRQKGISLNLRKVQKVLNQYQAEQYAQME